VVILDCDEDDNDDGGDADEYNYINDA